jgi:hypothetical protein
VKYGYLSNLTKQSLKMLLQHFLFLFYNAVLFHEMALDFNISDKSCWKNYSWVIGFSIEMLLKRRKKQTQPDGAE